MAGNHKGSPNGRVSRSTFRDRLLGGVAVRFLVGLGAARPFEPINPGGLHEVPRLDYIFLSGGRDVG